MAKKAASILPAARAGKDFGDAVRDSRQIGFPVILKPQREGAAEDCGFRSEADLQGRSKPPAAKRSSLDRGRLRREIPRARGHIEIQVSATPPDASSPSANANARSSAGIRT